VTPQNPWSSSHWFYLQDKSAQLHPLQKKKKRKEKKKSVFPPGFAICLTQQVATCDTSRGRMASEASGPLLSEEGEFLVSKESITNIPGFCRPLRRYYFLTLKWFEGEVLERKMRLQKNACFRAVVCVHTQTGIGFVLRAFYKVGAPCVCGSPSELVKSTFLSSTQRVGLGWGSAFK